MVSAARSTVDRMRQEAQRASTTVRTGLVISSGWISGAPSTIINVDGRDFTNLPMAGELNLIPGQTVSVMRSGAQLVVIGPGSADTMPLQGTVSATGASTCQVQLSYSTGARTVNAPWLTHYTPAIGDLVKLEWAYGTPVVVGKLSAALASSLAPPFVPSPPMAPPSTGGMVFTATDSGTLNRKNEYLSEPIGYAPGRGLVAQKGSLGLPIKSAYWFYGNSIKSSMVGRVADGPPSIFLDITRGAPNMVLMVHNRTDRSLPYPLLVAGPDRPAVPNAPFRGWFELPQVWWNWLAFGEYGISIVLDGPSGNQYGEARGVDTNSQSGSLHLPWKNA